MDNRDDLQIPDPVKRSLRPFLLRQIANSPILDIYELELFDWYIKETETLLSGMLSSERAFIQEQVQSGTEYINDTGMLAVEYYLKRVRYSHVIYTASLLETFLERSCVKLEDVLGKRTLPFTTADLKGSQWVVRKKFLERYGNFSIPKPIWSDIEALIKLRNNIVHDNGDTSALNEEEKQMFTKRSSIKVSGHEVVIEANYIHSALEAIKSAVQFVEKEIRAVVDRS
jgi:hypothetical protein